MHTNADPEAWAKSAWQHANAAKNGVTNEADMNLATSLAHLSHAVELLAKRMENVQGYNR